MQQEYDNKDTLFKASLAPSQKYTSIQLFRLLSILFTFLHFTVLEHILIFGKHLTESVHQK